MRHLGSVLLFSLLILSGCSHESLTIKPTESPVGVAPGVTSVVVETANANHDQYATYTVQFKVEAHADEIFIYTAPTPTVKFAIVNSATGQVVSTSTKVMPQLTSDAGHVYSAYHLKKGEAANFTFSVVFEPLPVERAQFYHMEVLGIAFGTNPDNLGSLTWLAPSDGHFRTSSVFMN